MSSAKDNKETSATSNNKEDDTINFILNAYKDIQNTLNGGEITGKYAWYSAKQELCREQLGRNTIKYEVEGSDGKRQVRDVTMITSSSTNSDCGWDDIHCLGKAVRFQASNKMSSDTESKLTGTSLGKTLWALVSVNTKVNPVSIVFE